MPEAPEGWYPNPANPTEELYWLGDRWSNARRPLAAPAAPPPPPAVLPVPAPTMRTSGGIAQPIVPNTPTVPGPAAVANATLPPAVPAKKPHDHGRSARIVGIVALTCAVIPGLSFIAFVPALGAITLGLISMIRTNNYAGKGLAGLIMGAVALLLSIIVSTAVIGSAATDDASSDEPIAAEEAIVAEPEPEPEATEEPKAEPTEEPDAEPAPQPAPLPEPVSGYGSYPDSQAQFVKIVEDSADAISAAETDLQRSQLLIARDQTLCTVPGVAGVVENWVGEVIDIGANGDGLAYITIEIAPTIVVQTWNNAFSDIGDNTLIGPDAPLFQTLVPMTEGTKVVFSGDFLSDDAVCVRGTNLTEVFYGSDPDFLVRFSNVAVQ